MRELRPNVWHWQSPHPNWNEEQWWPELVSSYGIALGDDFVLFDPLFVPGQLRERATAVVLTAPWHERDARRLGLPVHTPPADTWLDWVEKFDEDPDRVRGMESDDPAWLRAGEGEGHFTSPERGRSVLTLSPAGRRTISYSGCRRSARSSPATRADRAGRGRRLPGSPQGVGAESVLPDQCLGFRRAAAAGGTLAACSAP